MAFKIGKLTKEFNVSSADIADFLHKKGFADIEELCSFMIKEHYGSSKDFIIIVIFIEIYW